MNNIRIPFALLLLSTVTASAQSFDTLCYGTTARFWAMHGNNPAPESIIEFHIVNQAPVPVDTLLALTGITDLAYTGVFGLPTFAGSLGTQGTHIWDGANWTLWPGMAGIFAYHGANQSNLYCWGTQSGGWLWHFDGANFTQLWQKPAGYIVASTDIAVDSVGNAYLVLSNDGGLTGELRCISPTGSELATWILDPLPPSFISGMAMFGNVVYFCTGASGFSSFELGVPPNVTFGPWWATGGVSWTDFANCPSADFTLTDMARTLQPAAQLGLFPNPAQDQFQVVLPAAFDGTAASFTIVDDQGRTVWTGSSARAKFMVNAALEPGHYSVVADNGRARSTAGLVVVR